MVDQDHRRVAIVGDVPCRDFQRQHLVRTVAEFLHDLAAFLAAFLHVRAIARHGRHEFRRPAPQPLGRCQHRAADVVNAAAEDVGKRLAVDRQTHRAANARIVERRPLAVHQQIALRVGRLHQTLHLRHLRLHVLHQFGRDLPGQGQVEFAGDQRQDRGRAIGDDRIFDPVQIRSARLPVIRVPLQPDRLVLLELDELKRSGADRMGAHLRRRHMARINRRKAARQHHQQRRLRVGQVERDLQRAVGGDLLDVEPPGLVRVFPHLAVDLAGDDIPGAFHIGRGERLAVMPLSRHRATETSASGRHRCISMTSRGPARSGPAGFACCRNRTPRGC